MNKDMAKVIDLTEERFKTMATSSISYEAEKGFAMQLLMNNAYLMKVAQGNNASLAQAITNVAAIGLSLNPAAKEAYLIPRNAKEGNNWVSKIYLEPSYIGLCKLATDSGSIEWIQASIVYATDTFCDNGPGEKPTHTYNAFSKERGDFVGVYCVAKTAGGDFLTEIMPADQVYGIMERSEAVISFRTKKRGNGGPWMTDFGEQAKKTVVRRAFKMWPKTNLRRLEEAVHLSNENEGFTPILTSPEIKDFTGEQKSYYDQLIVNNDSINMFVLLSTVEETVRSNLYHSFEKGSKGKYQRIVDDLYSIGAKKVIEYVDTLESCTDDDSAMMEIIEELSKDALSIVLDRLSGETRQIVESLIK